ncbi:MAG: TlpA family protein disulfide reductase [Saprospiraceae bacterium]|nr:TlpA family protein disulfide reductase [Saprospiraceae bacterium]
MRILSIFTTFFGIALTLLLSGCITADNSFTRVAPGIWRGVLELEPYRVPAEDKDAVTLLYEQFKPGELPFNFEVKYIDNERFYLEIINGDERIRVDSIQYGRDRSQARDTMNFWFPEYQTWIHTEIRGGVMRGEWIVPTKKDYRIPFYAHAARDYRFTNLKETPVRDLTGQWATLFGVDQAEQEKAIGEFKQEGNRLTGTFRTETGDYRYLEGTVQGRKFFMSSFDGAHAFMFSGSIGKDSLNGEFRSGHRYKTLFTSWQDPNFHLADADTIAKAKGNGEVKFSIQTPDNQTLNFPGPKYDGKVKIFTIMGTWCPNCRDEQVFLKEFLAQHPDLATQMAITGFSFERHADAAQANAHLRNYKQKMGIPFDIVYAGKADRAEAANFFPVLDKVTAFPTMLILDKQNRVVKVHTGFDGPATSKYADFKADFEKTMRTLCQ